MRPCLDIVKEGLANYYLHAHQDPTMEDYGEEESHEYRLRADTALSTFLDLFMGRDEFRTRDVAERYLSKLESADDPKILNRFLTMDEQDS